MPSSTRSWRNVAAGVACAGLVPVLALTACSGGGSQSSAAKVLPAPSSSTAAAQQSMDYLHSVDSRVLLVNRRFAELGDAIRYVKAKQWKAGDVSVVATGSSAFAGELHGMLDSVPVPSKLVAQRDTLVRAGDEFSAVVAKAQTPTTNLDPLNAQLLKASTDWGAAVRSLYGAGGMSSK